MEPETTRNLEGLTQKLIFAGFLDLSIYLCFLSRFAKTQICLNGASITPYNAAMAIFVPETTIAWTAHVKEHISHVAPVNNVMETRVRSHQVFAW